MKRLLLALVALAAPVAAQIVHLDQGRMQALRAGKGVLVHASGVYVYDAGQAEIDLSELLATLLPNDQALSLEAQGGKLIVTVAPVTREPDPPGGGGETTARIEHREIAWSFADQHEWGVFANGDPWVVGPVALVGVDPPSVTVGGRTRNGSVVNPSPRDQERVGTDSAVGAPLRYVAAMNVALGVSAANPLILAPGASLVSTISYDSTGGLQTTRTAEVLTVLAAPAPEGAFRPPWAGRDKAIRYNLAQVAFDRLAALEPVSGAPSAQALLRAVERPWYGDQIPGWIARAGMAADNMPTYGRDIAAKVGEVALAVHMSWPREDRELLALRLVQLGIDTAGIALDGGEANWTANGGHASGRKWPILFAGLMLEAPELVAVASSSGVLFGEDCQTYWWRDGLAEWGIRHCTEPQNDQPGNWLAPYRDCCTANAWDGIELAARIMDAQSAWAHDPFFAYLLRYKLEGCPIYQASGDGWKCSYVDWVGATWTRYDLAFR